MGAHNILLVSIFCVYLWLVINVRFVEKKKKSLVILDLLVDISITLLCLFYEYDRKMRNKIMWIFCG